jgi:TRAP-type mannitol/chloroaromatic compound transport system permease small subunit
MIAWVRKISQAVQLVTSISARIVSLLAIILTLTVSIEVIGRYVFNHPTSWVWPISKQLFGIYILMALAYTESKDSHIRIEMFYDHFPRILKKFADWLSFIVKTSFMAVLVWQTAIMAMNSIEAKESASGAFKIPLYPFKSLIFLSTLLIICEIIVSFLLKRIDNKNES